MTGVPAAVHAVVIDACDLHTVRDFWAAILGLGPCSGDDVFQWLGRMGNDGPSVVVQRVPEPRTVKNRVHLDMHVPDVVAFGGWVRELGGRVVGVRDYEQHRWTVMADPEGNEFCVFETAE